MNQTKKKQVEITRISSLTEYLNLENNSGTLDINIDVNSECMSLFNESNLPKTIELLNIILSINEYVSIRITDSSLKGLYAYTQEEERAVKGEFSRLKELKDVLISIPEFQSNNRIYLETPGRSYVNSYENIVFKPHSISLKKIYEAEQFIKKIADEIRSKNYSPIEQIYAAYSIVIKSKRYREENEGNPLYEENTNIYSILENNNIVCEGYVNFFNSILGELGIPSGDVILTEQCNFCGRHAVSIVEIKDSKYGIEGNYVFDPSTDSLGYYNELDSKEFTPLITSIRCFAMTEKEFLARFPGINLARAKVNESGFSKCPIELQEKLPDLGVSITFMSLLSPKNKDNLLRVLSSNRLDASKLLQINDSYLNKLPIYEKSSSNPFLKVNLDIADAQTQIVVGSRFSK